MLDKGYFKISNIKIKSGIIKQPIKFQLKQLLYKQK